MVRKVKAVDVNGVVALAFRNGAKVHKCGGVVLKNFDAYKASRPSLVSVRLEMGGRKGMSVLLLGVADGIGNLSSHDTEELNRVSKMYGLEVVDDGRNR